MAAGASSNFGPLQSQTKQVLYNLYKYFEAEVTKNPSSINTPAQLVEISTGVSIRSVQKIVAESKTATYIECEKFVAPKIKKPRICPTQIDDFNKEVIRRTIYNFHLTQKEFPTLKVLHAKLKEDIDYQAGISTLRKQIKCLGFKWKKTEDNRRILMERHNIRLQRINFLTKIAEFRSQGRPIVYTDETYIQTSHTSSKAWTDGTTSGLKQPVSKGNRLIIVHAGGKDGFVPNALLMFKANQKTGDYHNQMNFENYEKWLRCKLIPNLEPNSVLVIDNASYHSNVSSPAPTSSSRKQVMIDWLLEHNIIHSPSMLKPALYELILQNKERFKQYKVDNILKEYGHSVLRLPPYHPTFNPIENIWSIVKGYVAKRNISLNMQSIMALTKERMETITKEEWQNVCRHVEVEENQYRCRDPHIDSLTENFNFVINTYDETSDESDFEENSDE